MLTTFTYVPVVLQFGLFICLRSGGRGIHPASRRVPAWWGRDQRWWSLWVQTVPKWGRGVVGEGKVGLSPRLQQRGRWGGGGRRGSVRRQSEVLERRASAAQLTCCPLLRLLGRKGPLRGPSTIHVLSQQGYDIQPQSSAKNLTPLLNLLSCVSCTIICIAYFFCCSMKRFY